MNSHDNKPVWVVHAPSNEDEDVPCLKVSSYS